MTSKKAFLPLALRAGGVLAASLPFVAFAQSNPSVAQVNAEQEQRLREQQQAREREQAVRAPAVRAEAAAPALFPALPTETPCFRIDHFKLELPQDLSDAARTTAAAALRDQRLGFADAWLAHYQGSCVGRQGVEILAKGVSQAILGRGYVTTRVLLPEQDLSTGTLRLAIVPGTIGQLRFADPGLRGSWKSAFPARAGDLLNLRDLEQGLEQMKRVASQDVDMQIVPTELPGVSDVVIAVKRGKPWTIVASVDNSGSRSTGRRQGNLSLSIDNPLGLNDLFNAGYNRDLDSGRQQHGTHGWNAYYSVPWGYWTGTVSAYANNYFQRIAGINQSFALSGTSKNVDLKLQRVISRSQDDVLSAQFRLSRRYGHNFIEGTEIPQQRRNNTALEIGLADRHYFGAAQFDGSLVYRQGVGSFGAQADTLAHEGGPTWRYRMLVADANLSVPFRLGSQPLRYVTTFRGQFTDDRLYPLDALTIGSRYTVRGFDGELQLLGDRGFYWRHELQVPIGATGQSLYGGLDYGHVYGPSTAGLAGTQLAGAVIGVRGGWATAFGLLSYDLFLGTPVYKPSAFHAAGTTGGFQLIYQY